MIPGTVGILKRLGPLVLTHAIRVGDGMSGRLQCPTRRHLNRGL